MKQAWASEGEACILTVDDRPANLVALERALAGIPAHIVRAGSGEEALAASLRQRFDLAIVDVQMPGMDGYELAELLRSDAENGRMPIIFVTAAYADESHMFKGYTAGAVDYLVKPYDPAVLLAKVGVFLELAQHRRRLERQVADRTSAWRESEGRFEDLFNLAPQPQFMIDADDRVARANEAAADLVGCPPEQLVGRRMDSLLPGFERGAGGVVLPTATAVAEDATLLRGDGSTVSVQARFAPILCGGRPYLYASLSDVSERVQALLDARSALAEKELLLKEVHHRVKNNLQVLSSLLTLQLDLTESEAVRLALVGGIGRVRSMAMVHELLYGHPSLAEIDLAAYVARLADSLRVAYAPLSAVDIEAQSVHATIEQATPIGLLLHELVSNAFKHGLRGAPPGDGSAGRGPDVRVTLRTEGEQLVVVVQDRGPGLPPGDDDGRTLGVRLVRSLARQLRGSVGFENRDGLRVTFRCVLR